MKKLPHFPDLLTKPDELPAELSKFFIALRHGTKCPNCGGKKKDGNMVCPKCEKAERELDKMLEKGIIVEYADGQTETLTSRKSRTYKRKR